MKKYILLALAFGFLIPTYAGASPNTAATDNVKQEILKRCTEEMGEYGAGMVKECVEQDTEALMALNKYPQKYATIVSQCTVRMKEFGYAMVKACADEDIAVGEY